ncbi:MAG TPA: selenide, water dikinase SelD, partial [Ktedonobacter sp.]|nr:selenide, water dikinase SelD [Ktedonobacter sp.]
GHVTGGAQRNASYLMPHVRIDERLNEVDREILWDPQTSGGLFAAIEPALWPELAALAPETLFWRIGEVTERVQDEVQVLLEVH